LHSPVVLEVRILSSPLLPPEKVGRLLNFVSDYSAIVNSPPCNPASPWHSKRLQPLSANHYSLQCPWGPPNTTTQGWRSPHYNEHWTGAAMGLLPTYSCRPICSRPLCIWAVGRKRPPLCRGCAPATPPSKTIPHLPVRLLRNVSACEPYGVCQTVASQASEWLQGWLAGQILSPSSYLPESFDRRCKHRNHWTALQPRYGH